MSEKKRRKTQCEAVSGLMIPRFGSSDWWALFEIRSGLINVYGMFASEASISARLRQLRSRGMTVERRLRGTSKHLWEYRLAAKTELASQTGGRKAIEVREPAPQNPLWDVTNPLGWQRPEADDESTEERYR